MASLYRKWRPQTFSEVVGQEHVTKTLKNALQSGRLTHAYLFAGPRGTGKTTIARLLAKSLNCAKYSEASKGKREGSWSGEPCNECLSCKGIINGSNIDVMEIDAASNRGIEEIRELREKIKFAPTNSTYKVFIIDEVHMLTREAFNALLKTLEEPPKHAIFILATTEPHKLPATILSRCQRYDFKRAKKQEITKRLEEVAKKEGLKTEPAVFDLVGRLAEGSYRDAESLLDQVAAVAQSGAMLTLAEAEEILGIADQEAVHDFYSKLSERKADALVAAVQKLADDGIDIIHFTNRLMEGARLLLLNKSGVEKAVAAPEITDEEWQNLISINNRFSPDGLLDWFQGLVEVSKEAKNAPLIQMPLEMLIMKWCGAWKGEGAPVAEQVVGEKEAPVKVQDLTKVNDNGGETVPKMDTVSAVPQKSSGEVKKMDEEIWKRILEGVKPHNHSLYALLNDTVPIALEEDRIILGVRFRFHTERLYDKKKRQIIEQVMEEVIGRPIRIECVIDDKLPKPQPVAEEELLESVVETFGVE